MGGGGRPGDREKEGKKEKTTEREGGLPVNVGSPIDSPAQPVASNNAGALPSLSHGHFGPDGSAIAKSAVIPTLLTRKRRLTRHSRILIQFSASIIPVANKVSNQSYRHFPIECD